MKLFKNPLLYSLTILLGINSVAVASLPEALNVSRLQPLELNATNVTLISALTVSLLRFWTRKGDNTPVRYDWDLIAAGQDLPDQLYYLWDDGLVGHAGNGSYQQYDPVTQGTKFSIPVEPKGLFGYVSAYHKQIIKALGATWLTVTMAELLSKKANRNNPKLLIQDLVKKVEQAAAWTKLPKYANIGAGLALTAYVNG